MRNAHEENLLKIWKITKHKVKNEVMHKKKQKKIALKEDIAFKINVTEFVVLWKHI